jgi:hypothetical protein
VNKQNILENDLIPEKFIFADDHVIMASREDEIQKAVNSLNWSVLWFPCQSFTPPIILHSSSSVIQGWYNRAVNALSNSGIGSTPAKIKCKKE